MEQKEKVNRLIESIQRLILKMQEVDSTCLMLTQDINKQELTLISFIGRKKEVIMKEAADYLEIPLSTCTGIVDKLVKKGYLVRNHSDSDRRIVNVCLTKYGTETCDLVQNMVIKMGSRMLNDLSEEDQKNLVTLMEKVTSNLSKHVIAN